MIRRESREDPSAIHAIHGEAFPTTAEADLVDRLRENGHLLVSLVAVVEDQLVGHIAFSPVSLGGAALGGTGLAPVAVLPDRQAGGWGSALIRAGLDACRSARMDYVVVLGEPEYYRRFGFQPASLFGLDSEYDAGDAFMALELRAGCLNGPSGLVRYGIEFRDLG